MKRAARVLLFLATLCSVFGAEFARAQGPTPPSVPAARQANDVVIIRVRGEIDRWSELSVKRRLAQAEQSGADAVVLEIDSPGGEVGAVLEICNAIKGSTITNTVAWVHPNAYSGGAIIALACREIVTSSPASMGDAFPITFGLQGVRGLTPDERTKFLPPLLTEVADSARRFGYDEFLVQAMVVDGVELWSVRDAQTGKLWFINESEYRVLFDGDPPRGKPVLTSVTGGRASQQPELTAPPIDPAPGDPTDPDAGPPAERPAPSAARPGLDTTFTPASPTVADLADPISMGLQSASTRPVFSAADRGRFVDPVYISDGTGPIVLRDDQLRRFGFSSAIVRNDDQLRDFFAARRMIRTEQTWSESMVRFLMNPIVRGVLIVMMLLGLFVEMSSPGMILPGSVAVGALIAILAPPMLVGMAGWWELAALALGGTCLLIELFVVPGFGVFGVVGLVALFVGLVGTFIPDGGGGLFGGDEQARTGLLYGVTTVLLATTTAGIAIFYIGKHFGTLPILNRLILDASAAQSEDEIAVMTPPDPFQPAPGDLGVAVSPLRPSGRAEFNGRMLDAIAQRGIIDQGSPVEIVERRGFAWVVRPARPGGHGAHDA
jgi:membrane-bound ClpP family serine protease